MSTDLQTTANAYQSKIIAGWEKLYREKRRRLYELLQAHFKPGRALELGTGDGESTSHIAGKFDELHVVDGSSRQLDAVRARFPNVRAHCSLFEAFEPQVRFSTIFMTHILEHLDEPQRLLVRAALWLEDDGRVMISVPNALSLHRLAGVKMGMLPSPYALNEQDVLLGHRRVYDKTSMLALIDSTPFEVVHFTGLMLKPLSNRQIERDWSPELIEAYFQLGFDFPELCSEIIFILEKRP
jgi:trans-aconitate methyltransferase